MFRRKGTAVLAENYGFYAFRVAGESYHRDALARASQSLTAEERTAGRGYVLARLVREPKNQYDPNAVAVHVEGRLVGHVPRPDAPAVGAWLLESEREGREVWIRAVIVWRPQLADSEYGVWLDLPPTARLGEIDWIPLDGAPTASPHSGGGTRPSRPGVVELWPNGASFDVNGKGSLGYRFAGGGLTSTPDGCAWAKLSQVGLRHEVLQAEDFRPGSPLRLALDPDHKKPNTVSVWSGTRDLFVGYLLASAGDQVAAWLRGSGARAYATAEWWEDGARSNIGVLCTPMTGVEVSFMGEPLPTVADAMTQARQAAEAATAAKEAKEAGYVAATTPRELAKFGPLVAKASDEKTTVKDVVKIEFLAGELLERLEAIGPAEVDPEDTSRILRHFGLEVASLHDVPGSDSGLNSLTDDLQALIDIAEEYAADWDQADREDREDLRYQLSAAADDLTEKLMPLSRSRTAAHPTPDPAAPAPPPVVLPPAGWYPNPEAPGQRYWDGRGWTEYIAP
jgi:hypothetical protein